MRQLRFLFLSVVFALWSISMLHAEISSNGWEFAIRDDGTAAIIRPVSEVWTTINGTLSYGGITGSILSNLAYPSSVQKETITWDNVAQQWITTVDSTVYTVSEINNGGMSPDQRAAVTGATIPNTVTKISNQ